MQVQESDRVEILTLQDNFIDLAAMDGSEIVQRAAPLKGLKMGNSVLAEHGFSSYLTITSGNEARSMLFDFGFSEHGSSYNAAVLEADMSKVEAMVLSHGHMDHLGGFEKIADMVVDSAGIEFVVHPDAFLQSRYLKFGENLKISFPRFSRETVINRGLTLVETKEPYPLLNGNVLYLGEIPRVTDFEKGFPIAYYEENGVEKQDPILDDTSVVMNLKGKGLIIISGCAHAGIINTIQHAVSVTGIEKIHAVIGGFHLTGSLFESIIPETVQELKRLSPRYIVPTHCTGRKAMAEIEREMPDRFLLNMSGTKLVFAA